MDNLDRRLLNEIQSGFPITRRPYKDLGERLKCSEAEVFDRIRNLRKQGIIR